MKKRKNKPPYNSLNEAFEMYAKIEMAQGAPYKAQAYRRAIIDTEFAGKDLREKIAEYNKTGRISSLDALLDDSATGASVIFNSILGFGPAIIEDLIRRKLYTIQDVRAAVDAGKLTLPRLALLGLQHEEDLRRKIPRDDVAQIGARIIEQIERAGPFAAELAGSYRRGRPFSGDVDIIARVKSGSARPDFLKINEDIIARIKEAGVLVDVISSGETKLSILYKHNWVVSVDILYASDENYFAMLLHFTGSQRFNIWLREECRKRGYSLSQYGLKNLKSGSTIQLTSEKHVFDIIGLEYVPPENRN